MIPGASEVQPIISHDSQQRPLSYSGWGESIGQSMFYSLQTGKKAGIVLILETMKDRKYWIRLNTTIEHFNLPIDTWSVGNKAY